MMVVARKARSIFRGSVLSALALAAVASIPAHAQPYPARVVRYVVPTPAGSGADTIGRIVAGGLTQAFGQQVIVENRAGGGNNIGTEYAAKAAPDGYTLLQGSLTNAVNMTLYRRPGYDFVRDFAPVIQLASSPYILIVHPSLPVKSVPELVRLAKARPGAINYASAGTGTSTYLAGELLKELAAIDMVHVPYRGGNEAMTSVMSGETSVYFSPLAITIPFLKDRRLRALAVTTSRRLTVVPEYPTVAEAGYPDYFAGNWFGILVPAKTPPETTAAVREAALKSLGNPDVARRLTDLGYVIVGDRPEEFSAHIRSEIDKLGKIVRKAGLSAD
jgi:tripartite-type tricarboxylate transporter receptor subunit TctC